MLDTSRTQTGSCRSPSACVRWNSILHIYNLCKATVKTNSISIRLKKYKNEWKNLNFKPQQKKRSIKQNTWKHKQLSICPTWLPLNHLMMIWQTIVLQWCKRLSLNFSLAHFFVIKVLELRVCMRKRVILLIMIKTSSSEGMWVHEFMTPNLDLHLRL